MTMLKRKTLPEKDGIIVFYSNIIILIALFNYKDIKCSSVFCNGTYIQALPFLNYTMTRILSEIKILKYALPPLPTNESWRYIM